MIRGAEPSEMCSGRRSPCPSHQTAVVEAPQQQSLAAFDERLDAARNALGDLVEPGTGARAKGSSSGAAFGAEAAEVGGAIDLDMPGRGEETRQTVGERLNIGPSPVASAQPLVQHAHSGEADHFDQPVDGRAGATDPEAAASLQSQRYHPDVDAESQAAVEPHLVLGISTPGSGCGKIETFATQGLFQFIDVPIGQKYPREMRFDSFNVAGGIRVGFPAAEERHLAVDIDLAGAAGTHRPGQGCEVASAHGP